MVRGNIIKSDCYQSKGSSKGQQILLHLLNFYDQRDKDIVSELITQHGIQHEIKSNLSHVSRELNKYKENEYVTCKLIQIENKTRKYYAYFLTQKGFELSTSIKESISTYNFGNINYTQKEILDFI